MPGEGQSSLGGANGPRQFAPQTEARDLLVTVRNGLPIVLIATLAVAGLALLSSLRQSPLYRATSQVFVATNAINTALGDLPLLSSDPVRIMATQSEVARVPEVAETALKTSNADDVTPQQLLGESTVTADSGADSLTFTVNDSDPDRATELANAYAAGYVVYRRQLDTEALHRARVALQKEINKTQGSTSNAAATDDLVTRSQSLRTKELLQQSNSTPGQPATGAVKVQPKPVQSTIVGAVIGLILGIGIVFVRDALNTRVRTAEEIESRLGMPLLGRVPPPPKELAESSDLAVLSQPHSLAAEPYRMLATSIELANLDRGAKSIVVTSALSGEGKSTTSASLGVTFARRGFRVVILEADVRKPTQKKLFNLEDRPGLSDVVLGRATLDDALAKIDLPTDEGEIGATTGAGSLEVLLSGPTPPSPPEFLKSRAVAKIIHDLTERSDLVIIDTPPLLHLSDVTTMMLSSEIDCAVAAVRLGVSRRHTVDELRRIFGNAPVVQLGFFVTGASQPSAYGYGYGYGYGDANGTGNGSRTGRAASAARQVLTRGDAE